MFDGSQFPNIPSRLISESAPSSYFDECTIGSMSSVSTGSSYVPHLSDQARRFFDMIVSEDEPLDVFDMDVETQSAENPTFIEAFMTKLIRTGGLLCDTAGCFDGKAEYVIVCILVRIWRRLTSKDGYHHTPIQWARELSLLLSLVRGEAGWENLFLIFLSRLVAPLGDDWALTVYIVCKGIRNAVEANQRKKKVTPVVIQAGEEEKEGEPQSDPFMGAWEEVFNTQTNSDSWQDLWSELMKYTSKPFEPTAKIREAMTFCSQVDWKGVIKTVLCSDIFSHVKKLVLGLTALRVFNKDIAQRIYQFVGHERHLNFTDAITSIIEGIEFFETIAREWFNGASISDIFVKYQEAEKIRVTAEALLKKAEFYRMKTEQHKDVSSAYELVYTEIQFFEEFEELRSRYERLRKKTNYSKQDYAKLLDATMVKLGYVADQIKAVAESYTRIFPFGVSIVGTPGIGKGDIVLLIDHTIQSALYGNFSTGRLYTPPWGKNCYWDKYSPLTQPGLRISEPATLHERLVKEIEEKLVLLNSIMDTTPMMANMASLDDKGKVPILFKYVIIDTNNRDMNLKTTTNNYAAYMRRLLFVHPTVKPGYKLDNSNQLNSELSLADAQRWAQMTPEEKEQNKHLRMYDRYTFKMYYMQAVTATEVSFKYIVAADGRTDLTVDEMVDALYLEARKHYDKEIVRREMKDKGAAFDVYGQNPRSEMKYRSSDVSTQSGVKDAVISMLAPPSNPIPTELLLGWLAVYSVILKKAGAPWALSFVFGSLSLYRGGVLSRDLIVAATALPRLKEKLISWFQRKPETPVLEEKKEEEPVPRVDISSKYSRWKQYCSPVISGIVAGLAGLKLYLSCSSKPANTEPQFGHWSIIPDRDVMPYTGPPGDLFEKVCKNLRVVTIDGTHRYSNGLGISGNIMIFNTHLLQRFAVVKGILCDEIGSPISITISFMDNQYPIRMGLREEDIYSDGSDIIFVKVPGMFFQDITPHIVSKAPSHARLFIGKTLTMVRDGGNVLVPDKSNNLYTFVDCLDYIWPECQRGKCGTPLIGETGSNRWGIIGIHAAGNSPQPGKEQEFMQEHASKGTVPFQCYGIRLTKKLVQDAVSALQSRGIILYAPRYEVQLGLPHHRKSAFSHISLHVEDLGYTGLPIKANQTSKIVSTPLLEHKLEVNSMLNQLDPSIIVRDFGPPVFKARTIDGVYINPGNNNLIKFGKKSVFPPPLIASQVRKEMVIELLSALKSRGITHCRVLTIDEALNGIPDNPAINGINKATSAGIAFPGEKSKYLIGEPGKYSLVPEVLTQVESMLSVLYSGQTCQLRMRASFKDEPKLIEHTLVGKVRVFWVCELVYYIVLRVLLQSFFALIVNHGDIFSTAIGIDAHREAKKMHDCFTKFPNGLEWDYKQYDTAPSDHAMAEVDTIIVDLLSILGYDAQQLLAVRGVLTMMHNVETSFLEDVFIARNTPSGMPGTAEYNSLLNIYMIKVVFSYLYPSERFSKHVSLLTYGDDVGGSCSNQVPNFNQITIATLVEQFFGLTVTPASKSGDLTRYTAWDKMTFIKRTLRHHSKLGWSACLSIESLSKTLLWMMPSRQISPTEQIKSMYLSVLREVYMYDNKEVYEKLRQFLISHNSVGLIARDLPVYSEIDSSYD